MTRWRIRTNVVVLTVGLAGTGTAGAEDPEVAARAIGQAGLQAAGAVARTIASADTVPGYVGTEVPERGLTADGMGEAANARLADPSEPGGYVSKR